MDIGNAINYLEREKIFPKKNCLICAEFQQMHCVA